MDYKEIERKLYRLDEVPNNKNISYPEIDKEELEKIKLDLMNISIIKMDSSDSTEFQKKILLKRLSNNLPLLKISVMPFSRHLIQKFGIKMKPLNQKLKKKLKKSLKNSRHGWIKQVLN